MSSLNPPVGAVIDPRLQPLLPCQKPPAKVSSFYRFLYTQLPEVPTIYETSALEGTRAPSTYDINITPQSLNHGEEYGYNDTDNTITKYHGKGLGIIYAPKLLDDLLVKAAGCLAELPVDLENQEHGYVKSIAHPYWTTARLPPIIYSEKDTEKWIMDAILQPALLMHHIQTRGGKLGGDYLKPSTTHTESEYWPFLASAATNKVIPDVVVIKNGRHPAQEDWTVPLIVEVKSPSVCDRKVGEMNFGTYKPSNIFQPLMGFTKEDDIGGLIWFNWPEKEQDAKGHLDRIIVQVWSQMDFYSTNMCMLSWYSGTIFFLRFPNSKDENGPPRLVMSKVYAHNEHATIIATYAWIAKALDADWTRDIDLNCPQEHIKHWEKVRAALSLVEAAGVCEPPEPAGRVVARICSVDNDIYLKVSRMDIKEIGKRILMND